MDYGNLHFYHDGANPNQVSPNGKYPFNLIYGAIHTALLDSNHGSKPIWVTETGWAINPNPCKPDCRKNIVSPADQSKFEQLMLNDARTNNGMGGVPIVTHVFIYTADTFTLGDQGQLLFDGMDISQDGTWLPAGKMLHDYIQQYPTW